MYLNIVIPFPGEIPENIAILDLETRKVPTDGFVMANGERLKMRWQAFAAGIATGSTVRLVADEWEEHLLNLIAQEIGDRTIMYAATRQFDEMILKGRFTNARRAHEETAFFPAMPGAEDRTWMNIYRANSYHDSVYRSPDVASENVPRAWVVVSRLLVLVHLLRDVAELILDCGNIPEETAEWCVRILGDVKYAARAVGDIGT